MESNEKNVHDVKIQGRERLWVSGVDDVIGFDETAISLITSLGTLNIEGEALHIIKLDVNTDGLIEVTGKLRALYYTDSAKANRHRLFARRAN